MGGRKRTGHLKSNKDGTISVRVTTTIDGVKVRVQRKTTAKVRAVARAKAAEMMAAYDPRAVDVTRGETLIEAGERIHAARMVEFPDSRDPAQCLSTLRRYVFPSIGSMAVRAIEPSDITRALKHLKISGLAQASVQRAKAELSALFEELKGEGVRRDNPARDATLPKYAATVRRERAVLTDAELASYLAWEPGPGRGRRGAIERQVLSIVSRCFGGVRTGDLHALTWDAFDVEAAGFRWGYAPRHKTQRPQLLGMPAVMRPAIQKWWELHGRPLTGPIFPVRIGARKGGRRKRGSFAAAFRTDLQAAFEAVDAPTAGSRRWRELFEETEQTRPVDFHSWRRAYVQALSDADVTPQRAMALAGHADMKSHAAYLRAAGKLQQIPDAALPVLAEKAPRKVIEHARTKDFAVAAAPATVFCAAMSQNEPDVSHAPSDFNSTRSAEIIVDSSILREGLQTEKAPAMPFAASGPLLRRIDAALAAGDVPLARALIAGVLDRQVPLN